MQWSCWSQKDPHTQDAWRVIHMKVPRGINYQVLWGIWSQHVSMQASCEVFLCSPYTICKRRRENGTRLRAKKFPQIFLINSSKVGNWQWTMITRRYHNTTSSIRTIAQHRYTTSSIRTRIFLNIITTQAKSISAIWEAALTLHMCELCWMWHGMNVCVRMSISTCV